METLIRLTRVTLIAVLLLSSIPALFSQVAINNDGSNADNSAMLDVKSATKGFLLPRMNTAERDTIANPAEGLNIYNTDSKVMQFFNGIRWRDFSPQSSSNVTCGHDFVYAKDGQVYSTVQIGTQCWMAENLNIGIMITEAGDQTDNDTIEKYCYNNDPVNCDTYGGLYQWAELVQYLNGATDTSSWDPVPTGNVRGICPKGWHLPTDDEWKTMEMYLGIPQVQLNMSGFRGTDEGGKLKETGTVHWPSPNTDATNSSGFTALPGGYHYSNGSFDGLGYGGFWWSSSEDLGTDAWCRHLRNNYNQVSRGSYPKANGYSVRCIKD